MALTLNKGTDQKEEKIQFDGKELKVNSFFLAVIKFSLVEIEVFHSCSSSFIIISARKDNGEEKIIPIKI